MAQVFINVLAFALGNIQAINKADDKVIALTVDDKNLILKKEKTVISDNFTELRIEVDGTQTAAINFEYVEKIEGETMLDLWNRIVDDFKNLQAVNAKKNREWFKQRFLPQSVVC